MVFTLLNFGVCASGAVNVNENEMRMTQSQP